MSFSSEVKEELSKISNLSNKEAVKYEFMGYLLTTNVTIEENLLKFSTESEYNVNRFCKLLNNLNIINYDISIQGKIYTILCKISNKNNVLNIIDKELKNIFLNIKKINKEDLIK